MNIKIYSRKAIEKLLQEDFPDNVAVISFYDPPSKRNNFFIPPVDYSTKTKRAFQVAINDIDIDILEEYGFTFETYFTEAEELAEFIYSAKADGLDIICQCEYGQSRSAACAAAILEHFNKTGISIFSNYKYYPNQLVYNKVFDALEAYKTKLKYIKGCIGIELVEKLSLLNSPGLTIIAARPAMGKTTLAIDIALHCALHEEVPTAFFSLELSEKQLIEKISLSQSKIFIDDTAGISFSEMHKKCREYKDNHSLGLIVIDYFQLLDGGTAEEKAAGLKNMSLDLSIPVVVTSQLSRSCENCLPCITTAFGESGALANIADNVIFLYQEENSDIEKSGEYELIIVKSKNGKEGGIQNGQQE